MLRQSSPYRLLWTSTVGVPLNWTMARNAPCSTAPLWIANGRHNGSISGPAPASIASACEQGSAAPCYRAPRGPSMSTRTVGLSVDALCSAKQESVPHMSVGAVYRFDDWSAGDTHLVQLRVDDCEVWTDEVHSVLCGNRRVCHYSTRLRKVAFVALDGSVILLRAQCSSRDRWCSQTSRGVTSGTFLQCEDTAGTRKRYDLDSSSGVPGNRRSNDGL